MLKKFYLPEIARALRRETLMTEYMKKLDISRPGHKCIIPIVYGPGYKGIRYWFKNLLRRR